MRWGGGERIGGPHDDKGMVAPTNLIYTHSRRVLVARPGLFVSPDALGRTGVLAVDRWTTRAGTRAGECRY